MMVTLNLKDLAKHRQVLGAVVAVAILGAIFVPFQKVNAFTVGLDFPDSDDSAVSQSVTGENFEITIDVNTAELISVNSIELILDNGESSVNRAVFDSSGHFSTGSGNLVVNNKLTVTPFTSTYGYGYGYGYVTAGTSFNSPYSYAFTYGQGFVGGNTLGYSNSGVTNSVLGLIGPGQIVVSGTLKTANLAAGSHTLDVLIDTGAGGNGSDKLTAPTFDFTVAADSSVVVQETSVTAGSTNATIPITGFEIDGNPVTAVLTFGSATTTNGVASITIQSADDFVSTLNATQLSNMGIENDDGDITFQVSNFRELFVPAGFIADIDVSSLGLPAGTDVTISLSYDDSGMSSTEEQQVRLLHLPSGDTEWVALHNTNDSVNNGDEVDAENNLVYGTTDSFSLFAPATIASTSSSGGGGHHGGSSGGSGGSGSSGSITFPDSYFETNPLARFSVLSVGFTDAQGNGVSQAHSGQTIDIASSIRNYQRDSQDYVFIVQVTDSHGITRSATYVTGTLEEGERTSASRSWLTEEPGTYQIQIFVWSGLQNPIPLSEVGTQSLTVS